MLLSWAWPTDQLFCYKRQLTISYRSLNFCCALCILSDSWCAQWSLGPCQCELLSIRPLSHSSLRRESHHGWTRNSGWKSVGRNCRSYGRIRTGGSPVDRTAKYCAESCHASRRCWRWLKQAKVSGSKSQYWTVLWTMFQKSCERSKGPSGVDLRESRSLSD